MRAMLGPAAPPLAALPIDQLRPRSGACFYGGGNVGGTRFASPALLQPTPPTASPASLARLRPGTPGAGVLLRGR
jgi:hypothetical protein